MMLNDFFHSHDELSNFRSLHSEGRCRLPQITSIS